MNPDEKSKIPENDPPRESTMRTVIIIDWNANGSYLTAHGAHRSLGHFDEGFKISSSPVDALAEYIRRVEAREDQWRGI